MLPIEKLQSWPAWLYDLVRRRFLRFERLIYARITYQIPTSIKSRISNRQRILQYPPDILHRFARLLDLYRSLRGRYLRISCSITTSNVQVFFAQPLFMNLESLQSRFSFLKSLQCDIPTE